jgi:hypothetical protein
MKVAMIETENDGRDSRVECECPYCGAEYVENWRYYPGSFWVPPEWNVSVLVDGCIHLVDVDGDDATYMRWPRLYACWTGLKARCMRLFRRMRRWWKRRNWLRRK